MKLRLKKVAKAGYSWLVVTRVINAKNGILPRVDPRGYLGAISRFLEL
jgi:hypothetical protein